jgi:DNA-binding transcriptional MerR regulator
LSFIMDDQLTVAEIAQRAGIAPSHVRYYERAGLLPAPARVGRQLHYPIDVLERLATIARARDAGLSLDEIRELSELRGLIAVFCAADEAHGHDRA